ncbi:RHS repeat domain-containing protein [Treponema sp. OMZ 855]|uniref:RHS repeat domain-containing protein n=1 Tax=Treponema sp. OMZ 855 TaxID=1643512 RepID=UPI0020A50863|nr:RHS repeat-associated core domain-containing protein [Treponema sp. OMZ 855]
MDIKDYFYQRNYSLPRTAIEAEILFAARIMQVRFLKRLSGKTPLKQNSSGEKIGAESAVLHFVFFIVIVNKMQQSAKEGCLLKRNTVLEVFPLTAGIAGSGKTVPFEKRRSRYKETAENKAEAYRVYVEHLFSACDAVDARIFSKGDGNMTRKISTTNLPGARGNAYPKAELDYSLDYEYDPAYAHRLIHAGNRYYRYDANGNITAEKDGPFTEDDEFVFTYSYDPETDVYGTDYGFGLDAPKETEETHPENLFAYRRNYTWNEKNLLTKSSDRSYTVHYRYGEDGQRALKYTEEGRSETLYFNNFYTIHIPVQDKNNPQGLRVHKHIFVGNSRLVTAMTHTDNNGDNAEQREKRYYYHSDHLGSAQFVTDWRGRQYEHIEYTPYGELWIEEVAAGLDKLPFRFTGKEMDEETGLYYYGARYLDPKYSRWLSGDPALGEYVPKAPIDDEAKKHNENLPGMGGVFNVVNLHLYHYAGNNPVKYTDPDGRIVRSANSSIMMADSSDNLGTSQEKICNVGCVLTAYTRIAAALLGSNISVNDANAYANEHNLFSNENLLTPEAGAALINGLLEEKGVTDTKVQFVCSCKSDKQDNMIIAIGRTENFADEYFVNARIETTNKAGTETYGHHVNINHGAVFADTENGCMNLSLNDTNGVRKKLYHDSRSNTLQRFDLFKVVKTQSIGDE